MNGSDFIEFCEKHNIDPDDPNAQDKFINEYSARIDWNYEMMKDARGK